MYHGDSGLLQQARITEQLGDAIIDAVLYPIHNAQIETAHMSPVPRPVEMYRGPTMLTVAVRLAAPERDLRKALGLGGAIRQYLGQALGVSDRDDRFQIRLTAGNQNLLIELPHPQPELVTLSDVEAMAEQLIYLGIDQFNEVVAVDLWKIVPGMLISGRPGSGKTNAERAIAVQALAAGWQLWLIAAKGIRAGHDSSEWEDIAPHCHAVAVTPEEIDRLLAELDDQLAARARGEAPNDPGILLAVDELRELGKQAQKRYARLARLRRSSAFRTIAGAQVVSKEIDFEVRGCLTTRLAGVAASDVEARMATGEALGAEYLTGKGDMLLVRDGGRVTRLAVAKADTEDVAHILAGLTHHEDMGSMQAVQTASRIVSRKLFIRRVVSAWEAEAATHAQKIAPPQWLLEQAMTHVQRGGGSLPSAYLLREWHQQREGKSISKARCEQVQQAAGEWWGELTA